MFTHIDALGGFTLAEMAFLYGTAGDGARARRPADRARSTGSGSGSATATLDVCLIRPVPAFVQVAADRFALRRLGRLAAGRRRAGCSRSAPRRRLDVAKGVVLVLAMLRPASIIFGAIFVLGAAFQFLARTPPRWPNAFTYGGTR